MNAPAPQIDAESLSTKEMLEASIFSLYENPIERKNAMDEMSSVYGIDMETGIRIRPDEAEEARAAAQASFEEQEKQLAAQAESGEAAEQTEQAPEPAATAEAEAADPPPPDPAVEALQRQLQQERDARAALERQMQADQTAQQNAAFEARKAENARMDEEMEATLKAAEENYGEDYAKPMRMMFEQQKQARDATLDQQFAPPPPPETEGEQAAREARDALMANPTLVAWQEAGGSEWQRAIELDKEMQFLPEWQTKTFAERFTAVVEKVNAELAAAQRGTPEKPAKEETEVEKALDKLNAGPDAPSSLTDLGGGGAVDDATKQYAEMAPMDMLLSGMSVEEMDRRLDLLDGVAA